LICGPTPPPYGGIASVIQTILDGDLRDGYEFIRFSNNERRLRGRSLLTRIPNALAWRAFGLDGLVSFETFAKLAAFRRALGCDPALAYFHAAHGYDFLLCTLFAFVARRRGIPTLLHTHGIYDKVIPTWSRTRQRIFRKSLSLFDRIVVLSEGWREWFAEFVEEDRLVVLRNAVDTRRFEPRYERPLGKTVNALFIGVRDPERKGAYDVLAVADDVFRQLPEVRFVCVGEDERSLEETHVRGTPLADCVQFVGPKGMDEMVPYFGEADLLLLPSYGEGLPIVLLEAMAAGLPVVATPVNGIPEAMSAPEGGVFVQPGNRQALRDAIIELARDPGRRQSAGRANRRRVCEEFDTTVYARRLGALLESILEAR
jgi:glycosyltransferase involved in cell wall biosynthesis